ncbi:MAG: cysteine hydrolase [Actinomycetota bacterium]
MTELGRLVDPAHTVLITQECQNGSMGSDALWPALADAASSAIPNISKLVHAARSAKVPIVHCLVAKRPDFLGSNANAPLFAPARRSGGLQLGSHAAALIDEIGPDPTDIIITRTHSVSPLAGTGLDATLRNLGARTIVVAGVSVNVAIPSATMDAVNAGYRVVIPRDAVAGVPPDYADSVLTHTLSLLASVVSTQDLLEVWKG